MLSGLKNRLYNTLSLDAAIEGGFAYKAPKPRLSPARKQALLNTSMLETPRSSLRAAMSIVTPYWTKSNPAERAIGATLLATSLFMTWYAVQVTVDFGNWNSGLTDTVQQTFQAMMSSRSELLDSLLPQYPLLQEAINSDALTKSALTKYPNVVSLLRDPAFTDIFTTNPNFKELLGQNPSLEQVMMNIPAFKDKANANPELLTQLTTFKDAMSESLLKLPKIKEHLKEMASLAGGDFIQNWSSALSNTFNAYASGVKDSETLNKAAGMTLKEAWDQKDLATIALKYTGMAIISYKSAQYLAMRWRAWTTGYFTSKFMADNAFLRIKNTFTNIDNPGQRIQEDPEKFTAGAVSLTTGVMSSGMTLASFSGMLWGMGSLMGVPHGMFWLSAVYATALTGLTVGAGWKLPWIQRNKQRVEANLRRSIDQVSNNANVIAQNQGQEVEIELIKQRLRPAMKNSVREVGAEVKLIVVDATAGNLSIPIPWVVGAFAIAAGTASMGTVQTLNYAFNRVTSSLSFIVNRFKQLAEMKSTADRMYMANNAADVAHYLEEEKRQMTGKLLSSPTPRAGD